MMWKVKMRPCPQQFKTLCFIKVSRKKGWLSFKSGTYCSLMSGIFIVKALSWLNAETDIFSKEQWVFSASLHLGRFSAVLAHGWLLFQPTWKSAWNPTASPPPQSLQEWLERQDAWISLEFPLGAPAEAVNYRQPLSLDSPEADNMHWIIVLI